jgi:hypothetical protein
MGKRRFVVPFKRSSYDLLVGESPNPQQPSNSAYSQPPSFFTKGTGWLISLLSLLILAAGVFVGAIWFISDGGIFGVVLVIPFLVGGIGLWLGKRIRKGFYLKFPIGRVILILLLFAGVGWGLSWMLTFTIIGPCQVPGGC